MNTNKRTARIVGALYIIATAAPIMTAPFLGFLGGGIIGEPIPDYLVSVSANENQVYIGMLVELVWALAVIGIPIVLFPILKKHNGVLALGFFSLRFVEGLSTVVGSIVLLTLLTLSQEFVKAGVPDASYFQTLGTLLQTLVNNWNSLISTIVFSISALILNYILYRSRLIPRWLAIWGLVGAILHIIGGILGMFDVVAESSTLGMVFVIPLALEEMVFAVWLIAKGFNLSIVKSLSAKTGRE